MIAHSPLRLQRHFFTRTDITAHPEREKGGVYALKAHVEISRREDDPRSFQLLLLVSFEPDEGTKPGYSGAVQAVGYFKVDPEYPEERLVEMVETNGSTLLFGAIREHICNITARGPWPMARLNCVSFIRNKPIDSASSGKAKVKKIAGKSVPPGPIAKVKLRRRAVE